MELRGPNGSKLPEEPQAFWWSLKSSGYRGLFFNLVTGIEMTAQRKSQKGRCASISALHHLKDSNEVAVEGSQGLKDKDQGTDNNGKDPGSPQHATATSD